MCCVRLSVVVNVCGLSGARKSEVGGDSGSSGNEVLYGLSRIVARCTAVMLEESRLKMSRCSSGVVEESDAWRLVH